MITETLMKPGKWSIRLLDDAPRSVWDAVGMFDHIMVTPTRLEPLAAYSDTNIKAASRYTGPVLAKPRGRDLEGAGMVHWLGTDKGAGDMNSSVGITLSAANLSTAVTAIRPISLSAGTVTSPGGTVTQIFQWMTRREMLDWVCRALGAEYRINPDGTLDAAVATTLFTSTPTAIIAKNATGPDPLLYGVEAVKLEQGIDVYDYARTISVIAQAGDGAKVPIQSATGPNIYKDINNNNVIMERLVNAPDASAGIAANYATSILANFSTARQSVQLSSRSYSITGTVKPGDWVWVYDLEAGLYDTANPIYFRGQTIHPVKLRCRSITWPVQRGMGVYARRSAATPTSTDLTPWVAWEDDQETIWEVGTGPNDPNQDETQFQTAYLGVNPEVMNRARIGQKIAYTPAFSGTVVNGTLTGDYTVVGDMLEGNIAYTRGSSDSHAAASMWFGTPSGLSLSMTDRAPCGQMTVVDASPVAYYSRNVQLASGALFAMTEGGTFVSNTSPIAIATGDQYLVQYRLRLA